MASEGVGGGMEWEVGVSRCKLFYGGDKQQDPILYSTANHIKCPMINHDGKEHIRKRVYVYIYIAESLCCTAKINTTL